MPLKIRTLGDLISSPLKPREDLLGPWLKERQTCMIYAPTGLGKSMLAMSIAIAVAGAGDFTNLNWYAPKARKVLVVDGEMDMEDLKNRADYLMNSLPSLNEAEARRNLQFLARQDQDSDVVFPNLDRPEGRAAVLKIVKENKIELLVLDNLSTLADLMNENDAHSFNGVLELLKTLKQLGCATILIHHSSKGNNTYRGTSKMGVIFDTIIKLSENTVVRKNSELTFDLIWEKSRKQKDISMRTVSIMLTHESVYPEWSAVESEDDLLNKITTLLLSLKYSTDRDLAAAAGISASGLVAKKRKIFAMDLLSENKWEQCIQLAKDNKLDVDEGDEFDFSS